MTNYGQVVNTGEAIGLASHVSWVTWPSRSFPSRGALERGWRVTLLVTQEEWITHKSWFQMGWTLELMKGKLLGPLLPGPFQG